MDATGLQIAFFKRIKDGLPAHIAMVDEVAGLLNISTDSAYRRIRGEKTLALDEIQLLARHYSISLDQFFHIKSKAIVFGGNFINRDKFTFENYLQGIVHQLSMFNNAQQKEMFYLNKDVPLFHHFMFPELAAFKCYFWSRYNLNNSRFNKGQLLISEFIDIFDTLGKQISDLYQQIPSTEIWNLDCINTTIRQVDYYRESKIFKSDNDIITVYHCLEKLVDHIEQQVELGYKFPYGKAAENTNVKYTVFINEFALGDNTVLAVVDGKKLVFVNHNVINYAMTTDEVFVDYTYESMRILLKKSTLISEIGEKDRQLFFDNLRQRIYEKRRLV